MSVEESKEMYLETIYILHQSRPPVRSIDVAEYMGYARASVSRAVKLLKAGGYISVCEKGYISLTEKGLVTAKGIMERHTVLSNMLVMLGVDEKTATEDACRIEHVISEKSFEAIKQHIQNNRP